MPLKHNITKHDVLATRIRKLSMKGGATEQAPDDIRLFTTAVIIASFSSGLSWKTHNALMEDLSKLKSPEVKEEYKSALSGKWKNISVTDVSEILSKGISDVGFSTWMYFNVDKKHHGMYKDAWESFQKDFLDSCDDLEVARESK
jgi:hypothetical protein